MDTTIIAELFGTAQSHAQAGRPDAAAALYRDWLAAHAESPYRHAVLFNHAVVLSSLGAVQEAAVALQEAVAARPNFLPAHVNLGVLLERLGAADQAFAHWTQVTTALAQVTGESVGHKAAALKLSASLLEGRKMLAQAEAALRQMIELGQHPADVVQHWIALRQRQCTWPLLEPVGPFDRSALLRRMAPLSLASYADDPLLQLAGAAACAREEIGRPAPGSVARHAVPRARPGRLRIGYLSSDLRDHAIGYLTADMFHRHDRDQFEVFLYYCGIPAEDATKARIRDGAEHWVDITPLDDDAALALMLRDAIDILVDINGHTRSARSKLLARRPAPVIVNWLGFAGTMGTPYHHYIIADPTIIPEGHEIYYTERVLRLPCYQPNDRARVVAPTPTRAECGLPENATVFCSFNGAQKITPFLFARWMDILRAVPDSLLWLLKGAEAVDTRQRALAEAAGIDPARLIFVPFAPNAQHIARYALADLFLDTTPYGAHTTASDALWMGVPILTMPGRGFASRVCASLVRAAGIPGLVCATPAEYTARAIALGHDRLRLATYRDQLLAGRHSSLLFDTAPFTREMEALFRRIWAEACAGRLPVPEMTNLDTYLEIGASLDHDGVEFSQIADYQGLYRAALAERHDFVRLPWDSRVWHAPDATALEAAA
ncbi:O-linked N-acetylglucosamine transferase, SPINDLY family protein [Plastoroseomonas arctica]|uniref:Glycosyl transferase n=1 Tax=Plastoroseomonas arctica TaxID=1509237 RepID=A0AAF1JUN9_9PROT|nr:O-linked N-acetylglucosamine transferase [Plastoroseomonas arctica]MBR0653839.1 glycosyl transferase [Plastoroseomonas arctica]